MIEIENYSITHWIINNNIKTEDGTPYQFKDYMFMFDVLLDLTSLERDVVCFKAAQIGFSTAAILATLWVSKNKGIDLIYTLPTQADVQQFAGGKINRIIAQNPVLQGWVKDKDTVEHKAVGDNLIYYRGTFSQKAAMMVSSDLNCYDEIDASKQDVVEQYSTRLQASRLKREWFFSHPSTVGNGVDRHWQKSDQKHWFIKCKHCWKEQYLEFPQSFDMDNELYICKSCKCEIDDDTRRRGRWIAKYKNREMSGYWIPLFICPWVTAKEIIKYYNEKSEEYFYNKVLGLPYVGGGNKLTRANLMKNLTDEIITPSDDERVVIGIDTGVRLHYVMGTEEGLFYNGHCDDYDEIDKHMERWKKAIVVIDQGGDLIGCRALRERYRGRVFLCTFQEDRKTLQLVRWGKKDEDGAVQADRNRCIQLVVDEFTDGRIPLQGNENDWHEYAEEWNNLTRIKEMDSTTGMVKRKVWIKTGVTDLTFATVYWRIGMSRFSGGRTEIISSRKKKKEEHPVILPTNKMQQIIHQKNTYDWRKI